MRECGCTLVTTPRYCWRVRAVDNSSRPHLLGTQAFLQVRALHLLGTLADEPETSLLNHIPKPELMKGMAEAVSRILLAVERKEKIFIFADYDVDGTSASAMLRTFFREIGYPVGVYIPDRMTEGYGLNPKGLKKIHESGGNLVITVDNGVSAVEACAAARQMGMDVIITDHHEVPPVLPEAAAILNPKQVDCAFPYKKLAGVGVAFYLIIGLRAALRSRPILGDVRVNLRRYLDFVALGTIADVVPLKGLNHILCRMGLEVMRENLIARLRPGLCSLFDLIGWQPEQPVDAADIGFKIGPRLNAAGRLGSALAAEDLLYTADFEHAGALAQQLDSENTDRQQLQRQMTEQAIKSVEGLSEMPAALVLCDPSWHPGVVGLVASRLLERYYRPVVVLGSVDGKFRGSGRSTHAVDLFATLNGVRDRFLAFGGHFHAVGLTLAPENLPWFRSFLDESVRSGLKEGDAIKPLDIDGYAAFDSLSADFLTSLERFEPYGAENYRPRWLIRSARVRAVKRIGKDTTANHARVMLESSGSQAWLTAFGLANELSVMLDQAESLSVIVEGRMQVWRGERRVELRLIDFTLEGNLADVVFC